MIVIIGRFSGSLGLILLLKLFCKYNPGIDIKDLTFLSLCGVIRGAIAFGLVLRLDNTLPNRELMITTSYTVVVITTVVFGSIVGYASKCTKKKNHEQETESSNQLETNNSDFKDD